MKKNPFYRPDNGIKPTSIPRKPRTPPIVDRPIPPPRNPGAPQPPLTIGDDPNNGPYMPSRPRRGGGGRGGRGGGGRGQPRLR